VINGVKRNKFLVLENLRDAVNYHDALVWCILSLLVAMGKIGAQ